MKIGNKRHKIHLLSSSNQGKLTDSTDILANIPDEMPMYVGNLKRPNDELKEVGVNQKIIPTFQALQMESFAKEKAKPYFHFVFELIHKIETRIIEKK